MENDTAHNIEPKTRRIIVVLLGFISIICVALEVLVVLMGRETSDALVSIAAVAVGALAGILIPK